LVSAHDSLNTSPPMIALHKEDRSSTVLF